MRLHVRRQPSLGRRQCETKTSASGAKLCKIITQLHPQRRILGKVIPLARLLKSRVCHKLASPIMAWVPPSSCTSRIPKQHPLDPPVRRRIRNMHRKFPGMFEALFRPSVQSMLLCECHCLSIGWCEHHKVFSSQTNLQARREKEMKTKQILKYSEVKPVCPQAALKGTGENKKNKATLCTLQCPSDRLLHVWTQKVTKCGIKFDHRFPSRATSNQMPKC